MAKQKNADDLSEIMSNQLDVLIGANVTSDDINKSGAIANMIGKTLKLASLRMAYTEYKSKGGATITALEVRK